MKKTEIHRIVYEELKQYLESCGYTHTTKGKKLKSPGGTDEEELKEVNPVQTGMKYMNKFQKGSEVGTIKAHDEDPSDNDSIEKDYEGKMVRAQMRKVHRYSKDIFNMVDEDAQLPAWVQSKLTKAADYIGMVKHYLRDYKQK